MCKPFLPLTAGFLIWGAVFLLLSCQTQKSVSYFQTVPRDTVLQTVAPGADVKIQSGDFLAIQFSSASPELSAQFNTSPVGENGSGGFVVDKNGTIELYKIGTFKVAGQTPSELKEKLQQEVSPYLKEPLVTVRLVNQQVTVLGEVGSPGVVVLNGNRLSILELIGRSGDLTENAKRNNVLVIRQTERGKEFHRLNLLDHSVFSSPYYYLQNNDVVYVEPEPKKNSPKIQQTISYIISGISVLTLILSRIQ